jgi:hypothetical protein
MKDSQLTSGECGLRFTLVSHLHVQAGNILEAVPEVTLLKSLSNVPVM